MAAKLAPKLITHKDASAMIGISTELLLLWAKKGSGGFPPPVRIVNHTYLFNRREVEKWVRVQDQPSSSEADQNPN